MVITVNTKINKVWNIVLPNKKINYFVFSIIILGIISGAFYFSIININEKKELTTLITNFFTNINESNINSIDTLKNSLFTNGLMILMIFILGMSVIGIFINIFIIYIKSFIIGFSISTIIYTYKIKGLLASFIYIFPHQIINIFIFAIIGIYSIMFSIYLTKLIINRKSNNNILKKYVIIFTFSLLSIIITSLIEAYILPIIFKSIITLYI